MQAITEFIRGLYALLTACLIVGLVLAVFIFGGTFLVIAGVIVGIVIAVGLVFIGIKESPNRRRSQDH